jgi:hypothetical protein
LGTVTFPLGFYLSLPYSRGGKNPILKSLFIGFTFIQKTRFFGKASLFLFIIGWAMNFMSQPGFCHDDNP